METNSSTRAGSYPRGAKGVLVEANFTFAEPWEPTLASDLLKDQIEAELTEPHPLFGKVVRTLAIRADSDDVLVQTTDGYAMVHLSWCRRSRPSPDFPHTLFMKDWKAFRDEVYDADVAAWNEENPVDDWELMIREARESTHPGA